MTRIRTAGAFALAAALGAAPALAQTIGKTPADAPGSAAGPAATSPADPGLPAMPGTAGTAGAVASQSPSTRNPALTDNEEVRASKVIGAAVYNDKNQQIGTIDDILLGKDQKASQVVLSVGGFLGVGSKLVQVPYSQLQFGNVQSADGHRVVLPNATKDGIAGMAEYHYSNG